MERVRAREEEERAREAEERRERIAFLLETARLAEIKAIVPEDLDPLELLDPPEYPDSDYPMSLAYFRANWRMDWFQEWAFHNHYVSDSD